MLRFIVLYQWQLRYNELCDENEITIVIKCNFFIQTVVLSVCMLSF